MVAIFGIEVGSGIAAAYGAASMVQSAKAKLEMPPRVSAYEEGEPFNIHARWQEGYIQASFTIVDLLGRAALQRTLVMPHRRIARMAEACRFAINADDIVSPTVMVHGIEFTRGEVSAIERVCAKLMVQRQVFAAITKNGKSK